MGVCVSRQEHVGEPATARKHLVTHSATKPSAQLEPALADKAEPREAATMAESRTRGIRKCPPQAEQQKSSSPSPSSTSLGTSTEAPFTGYNSCAWHNNTSSVKWDDGGNKLSDRCGSPLSDLSAVRSAAHRKSASIGVLERISKERMSCRSASINRNDDYMPQTRATEASADSTRKSLSARTRRLSSKFNDIPTQLGRFLAREEDEPMPQYLHRVYAAIDTERTGSVPIGEIIRKVFATSEHESMKTTLNAASTSDNGNLSAEQFIKFFAYLSGDNCLGAALDIDTGNGSGEAALSMMGESTVDEAAAMAAAAQGESRERALSMSVKLLYDGTAEVCPVERKGPTSLRDVRVKSLCGQSERIKCIAMSTDPRLYAVSHRHDCIAHIYTSQGKEVRRLTGHGDSLLGIAFAPNRKYIATVARDRLLVVWDCTVGMECHSVEHPGIVTAVAFAFDGKHVYTGCQDNVTRKISFPKGRLRATIPDLPNAEDGVIVSVAAQHTRNDLVVFSRSCDEHAYVAQADNLNLCVQLNGHETHVWQTAFSSNDDFILTCCERKIIVWHTKDFTPVGDFDAAMACRPSNSEAAESCLWTTAVFGPLMFKNLLFAFNTLSEMLVIDLDSPEEGAILDVHLRSNVYAASSSENGNCLMCGDDLGNVYQLLMR